MADAVTERFVYPPNYENPPDKGGNRGVIKQLTCLSDSSGETDVIKLDISELRMVDGAVPTRTVIEKIEYDIRGFTSIVLEWDRAAHSMIAVLSGDNAGVLRGPIVDDSDGTDRTGDILLTSNGADSGDSYNIILHVKLKA